MHDAFYIPHAASVASAANSNLFTAEQRQKSSRQQVPVAPNCGSDDTGHIADIRGHRDSRIAQIAEREDKVERTFVFSRRLPSSRHVHWPQSSTAPVRTMPRDGACAGAAISMAPQLSVRPLSKCSAADVGHWLVDTITGTPPAKLIARRLSAREFRPRWSLNQVRMMRTIAGY